MISFIPLRQFAEGGAGKGEKKPISLPCSLKNNIPQESVFSHMLLFNINMKPLNEVIERLGLKKTQHYLIFHRNPRNQSIPCTSV